MQIAISSLSEANKNSRIDSSFFRPDFMKSYSTVMRRPHSILSQVAHITDGNHSKIAENFDDSSGVRYLRGQDLGADMMLHDRNVVYIPESCFNSLKRSHIYKDDILMTIVGANTGLVGLVNDPPEKLVANCKLGIVRSDRNEIPTGYLYCFLTGRYGQHQILRSIRGGGQTGLILPDMRRLRIARLNINFESEIDDLVCNGHLRMTESEDVYRKGQTLLLSELGLTNWRPQHRLTFVKNYSDTERAGRIDADYFQPKYEEIVHAIKNYPGGWDRLENLVAIQKCVEVGSDEYLDEGVPFVRVSNLNPFEISEEKYISDELYAEIRHHQPKKGEILLSKDATPGIAHYLDQQPSKMIPSGGILRLKSKTDEINNEYLTLVLNSMLTKEQAKRDVGGSIILHWRPDQVKGTLIPILPKEKQTQIRQKVAESFSLRKQSRHLLECAKRAVEIAIEQDERTALDWLEDEAGTVQAEQSP